MALSACGTEFEPTGVELAYYEADKSAASAALCGKIERQCERRNLTIRECNEILESRGCSPLDDGLTSPSAGFNMNNGGWNLDVPGFGHGGDAFGDIGTNI
mgnify:CR=1 FL=1